MVDPITAMTLTTISRKGQATIPKALRERLKLQPNQRIAMEVRGEELVIRRAGSSIKELAGSLGSPVRRGSKKAEREAIAAHLSPRRP